MYKSTSRQSTASTDNSSDAGALPDTSNSLASQQLKKIEAFISSLNTSDVDFEVPGSYSYSILNQNSELSMSEWLLLLSNLPSHINSIEFRTNWLEPLKPGILNEVFAVLPSSINCIKIDLYELARLSQEKKPNSDDSELILPVLPTSVHTISFKGSNFIGIKVFKRSLDNCINVIRQLPSSVHSLIFSDCELDGLEISDLNQLISALPESVNSLNLSENSLNSYDAEELTKIIEALPSRITRLNLSDNRLGHFPITSLTTIIAALKTSSITSLNLSENEIYSSHKADGLLEIAAHLSESLLDLTIDDVPYSMPVHVCLRLIHALPPLTKLKYRSKTIFDPRPGKGAVLNLSNCKLDELLVMTQHSDGARSKLAPDLFGIIPNSTTVLDLSHNRLFLFRKAHVLKYIFSTVPATIIELNLSHTALDGMEVNELADVLKELPLSVKQITLVEDNDSFADQFPKLIAQLWPRNLTIHTHASTIADDNDVVEAGTNVDAARLEREKAETNFKQKSDFYRNHGLIPLILERLCRKHKPYKNRKRLKATVNQGISIQHIQRAVNSTVDDKTSSGTQSPQQGQIVKTKEEYFPSLFQLATLATLKQGEALHCLSKDKATTKQTLPLECLQKANQVGGYVNG